MPTITTAVRELRAGDVLLEPLPTPVGGSSRYAVLDVAIATPGPVGVQLARLGTIPPHLDRVATVSWPADAVLEVVRSRPTLEQAQRAVATLADGAQAVARGEWDPTMHPARLEARALLELRNQVALGLLTDVERLAAAGYAARVRLVHDELEVSAADVHDSVAAAVNKQRAEAWRKLEDERDRLEEERDNLRTRAARYKAQRDALLAFMQNADVQSGVCCCGDDVNRHGLDHSPVDQWDHSVAGWAKEIAEFDALVAAELAAHG